MMKWIAVLTAIWLPVLAQAAPRLVFTKSFPGSAPPWLQITVERDGSAVYKEAADDNNPISIHLEQADTDAIFALADALGHFSQPLEANLKVAFMGKKTFRYEDAAGTEKPREVEFNYSADLNAQALLDWFERIAESERNFIELERSVKYDKLGVQNALILVQAASDQKRLVAPEQFLPLLDRVVKNESYMHMARERAAAFAQQIRAVPHEAAAVNSTQK
jgi:hypothetical protein